MESNSPLQPQPAVQKDDLVIPVIDFGSFLRGTPSERLTVAISVTNAFKTSGFLYLKDHDIPSSAVSRVFECSARFFARPQDQKDSLRWTSPQSNRGYIKTGQEKLNLPDDPVGKDPIPALVTPDLKETMEIGRDDVDGLPNQWPDHLDDEGKEFKKVMLSFFETCKSLHTEVMRAIALGMDLPEHYFDDFVDAGDNNLRLLHYPSVSKETFRKNPGQVRAGEHSDYGSITLLFQDRRKGLQVRSPRGTFVDVTPIADTVVVNAGDLLARWSNDTIKSTRHRVAEPLTTGAETDDPDTYPARYSVAYFCNPNLGKFIEALPGTFGGESNQAKKYPGITAGAYLVQRLTATI